MLDRLIQLANEMQAPLLAQKPEWVEIGAPTIQECRSEQLRRVLHR